MIKQLKESGFDYQSDRHCSKTYLRVDGRQLRLITSQIDTAPKPHAAQHREDGGLITSQIDTAPKQKFLPSRHQLCLITSQIDTAPKQAVKAGEQVQSLITSQIDTAPKLLVEQLVGIGV